MSKVTTVLSALALLCTMTVLAFPAFAAPAQAPPAQITVEKAQVLCTGLEESQSTTRQAPGNSFVSCWSVHGTPCEEGNYVLCQFTEYEPELCICTDGTFQCGGLP